MTRSTRASAIRIAAIVATVVASAEATAQSVATGSALAPLERTADSLFAAKSYGAALAAYTRLTAMDSTVMRYWMQKANAALQVNEVATSASAFERAFALRGGPVAAYNAAALHSRMRHVDSAFVWLERAAQSGFADTATLRADDDLAALRSDARFEKVRYAMTHPPAPCLQDAEYRRFDFWVGSWRVTTVGGAQTGTSRVDVVSGGCGLLENWRDMRGAEGKSLNTYDPLAKQWRQFWVGQGGGLADYARSEWHDSTLSFYAKTLAASGKGTVMLRLSFTPLAPDVVRQFGEISTDDGATWTAVYDFRYHRVAP